MFIEDLGEKVNYHTNFGLTFLNMHSCAIEIKKHIRRVMVSYVNRTDDRTNHLYERITLATEIINILDYDDEEDISNRYEQLSVVYEEMLVNYPLAHYVRQDDNYDNDDDSVISYGS